MHSSRGMGSDAETSINICAASPCLLAPATKQPDAIPYLRNTTTAACVRGFVTSRSSNDVGIGRGLLPRNAGPLAVDTEVTKHDHTSPTAVRR